MMGLQEIIPPVTEAGELEARVTLRDAKGNPAHATASVLVSGKNPAAGVIAVTDLRTLSRSDTYAPGDRARVLLLFPEHWGEGGKNEGNVYVTVAGRAVHEHRVQRVKGVAAWLEQDIRAAFGTGVHLLVAYAEPRRGWFERRVSF